jgi:hypothetical protein
MANKEKPIYQPWNEDAFMGDTDVRYMDAVSGWIYRTLLQKSFFCDTRPYLPLDDDKLWKLAMCPDKETWLKHKPVVLSVFTEVDKEGVKFLYRKRVIDDWNRVEEIRRVNSENGRRGGRPAKADVNRTLNDGNPPQSEKKQVSEVKEVKRIEVSEEKENDMKAVKQIPVMCLKILGLKAEPWDNVWAEVKTLVEAYGNDKVVDAFDEWAKGNIGETFNGNPIQSFLKVAPGLLTGVLSISFRPEIQDLLDIMAVKSNNYMVFTRNQTFHLTRLLNEYTKDEILQVFYEFYDRINDDDYQLKFATRDFIEKAPQFLRSNRLQKQQELDQKHQIEQIKTQVQSEAAVESLQNEQASTESDELLQDTLQTFGLEDEGLKTSANSICSVCGGVNRDCICATYGSVTL